MTFLNDAAPDDRWVWLPHVLAADTPVYGGGPGLEVIQEKCIDHGDSCNTVRLAFSNHLGSHVDAPLHFVADGRSVEDYKPEDWLFHRPLLVDMPVDDTELVKPVRFDTACPADSTDADLLLIRTGFSRYRNEERYWRFGPGFSAELAPWLRQRLPNLRAVGLDCISIASLQHRDESRRAHHAFLGSGLRIFEDLALGNVAAGSILTSVIALPLRFANGDGAPCSVIGLVK